MTALFEFPIFSETLGAPEIEEITGAKTSAAQIGWLKDNGWAFLVKRSGHPVVGRMYARLKLSGITPAEMAPKAAWAPDFSGLS